MFLCFNVSLFLSIYLFIIIFWRITLARLLDCLLTCFASPIFAGHHFKISPFCHLRPDIFTDLIPSDYLSVYCILGNLHHRGYNFTTISEMNPLHGVILARFCKLLSRRVSFFRLLGTASI